MVEDKLPRLVRYKGLQEMGLVESYQGLKNLIKYSGFPEVFC